MGTKRDIGSSIKEGLNSFEASPDDVVWSKLEESLNKKKKRRTPIWLWFLGLSILLIGGVIGASFSLVFDTPQVNEIVVDENGETHEDLNSNEIKTDESFHPVEFESIERPFMISLIEDDSITNDFNDKNIALKKDSTESSRDAYVVLEYRANDKFESIKGSNNESVVKKVNTESMTYTSQNISQIDKDKQLADREKSNEKKFNSTASTPAKATDASVVTVKSEKEVMSHNISQIELDKQLAFQDNNDQKMTNAAVPDLGQETDVVYDQKLDSKLSRRDSLLNVREERLEERKKRRLAYQAKISNRNKRSDSSLIEEKQVEWSASISGLAVTLQNLGDNSAIGPDLNENDYDQDYSIGFGAAVHSKVSKNLQLSVGINYYKFNRTTKNISSTNVFLPINDPLNINLEYVNFNGNINQLIDNDGQSFDIEQELEYVSIPFTARYLIVDGMVSPYFTGGFSYVHLMDNSFVYIGNDGNTIRPLGDSNIINDFNVTFNFGAGLKFKLVDNIQFVTEGIFNYQFFQYKDRDVRRSVLQFSAGLEYKF